MRNVASINGHPRAWELRNRLDDDCSLRCAGLGRRTAAQVVHEGAQLGERGQLTVRPAASLNPPRPVDRYVLVPAIRERGDPGTAMKLHAPLLHRRAFGELEGAPDTAAESSP
jgi:hypothetical protein